MADFREVLRTIVTAEQCDVVGHMNVQFYIALMNDGGWNFLALLGLTEAYMQQRQVAVAAVKMEIEFLREFRNGDALVVESAVERVGRKTITLKHRLLHLEDGGEAMRAQVVLTALDLKTRKSVEMPEEIRATAERFASNAT